jgi:hypothetical protein
MPAVSPRRLAAPPSYVTKFFALPAHALQEVSDINDAVVSQTWLTDRYVLQARPLALLERMLLLHQMGPSLPALPGLRFLGPLLVDDGARLTEANISCQGVRLWDLQPRLPETQIPYAKDMSDQQVIRQAELVLPEVISQLIVLASLPATQQMYSLPTVRGTKLQLFAPGQLKSLLHERYPELSSAVSLLPSSEPLSELVVSHGDPILKNVVITQQGPQLIDFEAISILPRHMDLVHITTFICKRTHCQHWNSIIDFHWKNCRKLLPGWNHADWQLAMCWYLIRELVGFPPIEKFRFNNYLKGLQEQIVKLR